MPVVSPRVLHCSTCAVCKTLSTTRHVHPDSLHDPLGGRSPPPSYFMWQIRSRSRISLNEADCDSPVLRIDGTVLLHVTNIFSLGFFRLATDRCVVLAPSHNRKLASTASTLPALTQLFEESEMRWKCGFPCFSPPQLQSRCSRTRAQGRVCVYCTWLVLLLPEV